MSRIDELLDIRDFGHEDIIFQSLGKFGKREPDCMRRLEKLIQEKLDEFVPNWEMI